MIPSTPLTLKDVAEIIMGQSPAGEDCNREGLGLPLLNGPTEFGPSHPHPTQFTTDPKKRALTGDLLFCVRGSTTGRMNWADQEYAIGRGIAAIRHKLKPKLQPLVRAVIEQHLPALLQAATGSTFPNVSGPQLASIPFPSLKPSAAVAIASILGALDEKIELNRRMNETLEAIARAFFKDWFVDFGPTRAKMEGRGPYLAPDIWSLFPDRLDDEGKPEGWKREPLGTHMSNLDSKRVPVSGGERAKRQGPFPYHGATGVMDHIDAYLFDGIYLLVGEDGSVVRENGIAFLARAVHHMAELARIDEQDLTPPVPQLCVPRDAVRLVPRQKPQANRNLGRIEQLARKRDHAIHHSSAKAGTRCIAGHRLYSRQRRTHPGHGSAALP